MSQNARQKARAASARPAKPTGQEKQEARLKAAVDELERFCRALGPCFRLEVNEWRVSIEFVPPGKDKDDSQTVISEDRPAKKISRWREKRTRRSAAAAAEALLKTLKEGDKWLYWEVEQEKPAPFGYVWVEARRGFKVPEFSSAAEFELMMAAHGVDSMEGLSLPAI